MPFTARIRRFIAQYVVTINATYTKNKCHTGFLLCFEMYAAMYIKQRLTPLFNRVTFFACYSLLSTYWPLETCSNFMHNSVKYRETFLSLREILSDLKGFSFFCFRHTFLEADIFFPECLQTQLWYFILIHIQRDATLHSLFYLETALHISGSTTTHHQERRRLSAASGICQQ